MMKGQLNSGIVKRIIQHFFFFFFINRKKLNVMMKKALKLKDILFGKVEIKFAVH